ncbi:acyl-CoA dehydrogenase [Bordetella sp. N]|uniref:acyl-CoA dehydrogenase n=1 Tax=Bordetella sp. N TaxID=1746199 RepID=UPI00070F2B5D|nr:acyl-CoA dehydrogenase [Bordetella sp. N]ALM86180.1 hypothetical protein ASB57_27385 [Bordetella sp. N]
MPFEPKTSFPGLLADSAARLAQDLAARYPESADAAVLTEMGWNAVLIPEAQGGVGGEFGDLASIVEALAPHAVGLPVITRCGAVPAMLAALAGQPRAERLLAGCADGSMVVELGGPLSASDHVAPMALRGAGRERRITGSTTEMTLTADCTHVLLVCAGAGAGAGASGGGEPVLACVPAERLREHAVFFETMDEARVSVCKARDLLLGDDDIVASGTDARLAIAAGWRVAVAATATDTVCAMGSVLARTITYLLEREQFGQPLAQFQALRHDVARLYVTYETARGLLQVTLNGMGPATGTSTAADDAAVDLLGLHTSEEAVTYAETVIQLHGGMGMTREMPAARLATRLLANAMRFGDTLSHRHSLNRLRTRTAK